MNEVQRKVLRSHHGDILKNLVLDTDILGSLLQKDILSETMVQSIQAKSTQHEKIIELLFMLPKRGPKAFPGFLDAIRKHSSFLADKLEQTYDKEQKIMAQQLTDPLRKSDDHPDDSSEAVSTPPKPKQLPASPERKLPHAHAEKNTLNVPVKDHSERRSSVSVSNHVMTSNIIQQNLNNLFTKLRTHRDAKCNRELTFSTPEPATFKMVDKLVDELFESLEEYETSFSQCHALLGGKDRNYPLVSHIINLQKSKREMEHDLKTKEQQKNKYADYISKLENRCRNQSTEITHLTDEVRKLKEENEKLQEINSEREEKQKIIDDLRKMVMDADTTKKSKLRSSYLALHYDGTASEIRQLKVEVRNLKTENQSLRTENLMMKKSENLKKLAKLRTDNSSKPENSNNGHLSESNGEGNSDNRSSRQVHALTSQSMQIRGHTNRRTDMEKSQSSLAGGEKPKMSASAEQLTQTDTENKVAKTAKDKDPQDMDFKFANSQNGAIGHKRSPSKERSNKRVTFLNEDYKKIMGDQENVVRIPTGQSEGVEQYGSIENISLAHETNKAKTNPSAMAKSDKSLFARNRQGRPMHTKPKNAKRSASLNNLTSTRDIMKMSSQLIQKSRNMRH